MRSNTSACYSTGYNQPAQQYQQPYSSAYNAPPPINQGYSAPAQPVSQQQQYGARQYDDAYSMQPLNGGGAGTRNLNDMQTFFAEVRAPNGVHFEQLSLNCSLSFSQVEDIQDQIKQLHQYVNQVSELHARRLATTDDQQQSESASHLTELTQATSALTTSIRNRITKLNEHNKKSPSGDPDFNTRKLQIGGLQNAFKRGLEEYNSVEKKSRDKYRQRMERQIRIGAYARSSLETNIPRLICRKLRVHSQTGCDSG